MSKLSDTQAIVLSAACQRPDGNLLPLPGSLRGGAAAKVVAALLARGLAEERPSQSCARPTQPQHPLAQRGDGRGVLLLITDAGLAALGIGPITANVEAAAGEEAVQAKRSRPRPLRAAAGAPTTRGPRRSRERGPSRRPSSPCSAAQRA